MNEHVDAGHFGAWLQEMRASLRGDAGTNVPCGDCVGCCVSGYPVPIRPQDALEDVLPAEFLVPVSSVSRMLVARPDGTCPMLNDRQCSIYRRRPQTCRDYDCRIFAAAGIDAGGEWRSVINKRVRAWRFTYESVAEQRMHEAMKATARFIVEQPTAFPGWVPTAPTGIAVLTVKAFEVFLDSATESLPAEEVALAIIAASREFDRPSDRSA